MISVQEASKLIEATKLEMGDEYVAIDEAVGRILVETVVADRDFPPYDRVTMDGIAINFADWAEGKRSFPIQGTQLAGEEQMTLRDKGHCLEVMTGSICPLGVDTVIRYEDIDMDQQSLPATAYLKTDDIFERQNIHPKGTDQRAGDILIDSGVKLSAAEIAVAATVGKSQLKVSRLPNVAIISTGDELVELDKTPAPHQIRRSNSYMLQAALSSLGIPSLHDHFPDDQTVIEQRLRQLLMDNDVLILTGGVSKGKADYIPEILIKLGVQKLFHRVSQRPGKPFWFGSNQEEHKVVFALPGNPVSSFVGFHRYIRPWLMSQLGISVGQTQYAQLSEAYTFLPDLTYFLLVEAMYATDGRLLAKPIPGSGSGDLANLLSCNGFLELPAERSHFDRGEVFPFYSYRL